jgi:DNA replication initiation complex subunit (GINS family)
VYNDLYKAWKAEKTSEKPQTLSSDFYQRATGYLKGLEDDSVAGDTRTIQGRLLVDEKDVAKRLLDEIKQTRLHKIVNAARDGNEISRNDLTDEERKLVEHFNESLSNYKEHDTPKQSDSLPEDQTELSVVRFLDNVPEIVGVDLKIYGPYKKEDVGSLPNQNAQALIKQGLAKEIDVKRVHHALPEELTKQLHQQ